MDKILLIDKTVKKLKMGIQKAIKLKNYEDAFCMLRNCADLLYQTNQYYRDDDLETMIRQMEELIIPNVDVQVFNQDAVVFYDGFGLNQRGLAQIYLKALTKCKKVYYLTDAQQKNEIPTLKEIIKNGNGEVIFLATNDMVSRYKELVLLFEKIGAGSMFFYSTPSDISAITAFNRFENTGVVRYQINLTDHAFWLGCNTFDYCIEFRDYGAYISNQYRKIPKEKIVKLPYYPQIDENLPFEGYPFDFNSNSQKLIFSGGSLYKTIDESKRYYKMIAHILEKHPEVVFWYCGSGDRSDMDRLVQAFPNRVFLTPERRDFYQIIKHSTFYLSTYPIVGGLMFQYAAATGKKPLTLSSDDCDYGMLFDEDELGIFFDSEEELLEEADCLLNNQEYAEKQAVIMRRSVMTEKKFNNNLKLLLENHQTENTINYSHVDTKAFRKGYLYRIDEKAIKSYLGQLSAKRILRYYPFTGTKILLTRMIHKGKCLALQSVGGEVVQNRLYYDLPILEEIYSDSVSVVVVTYNPQMYKLIETLTSIIKQKEINFEIIVSDDGSANNLFDEIEDFFKKHNFFNYKLIAHKENQGTVINFYDALQCSKGKFVKSISPGDGLMNDFVLRDWVTHLEKSSMGWSFSDAIYYRRNNKHEKEEISLFTHPQMIDIYSDCRYKMCQWNYMIYDDIALGAAILCRRRLIKKYLGKIVGKIKYAEDNIFRMMMFDGIVADYFPENAIFYEVGEGVSTSGDSIWQERIRADWRVADDLMYNDRKLSHFQRKVLKYHNGDKWTKRIIRYTDPTAVKLSKKWRCFQKRKSDIVKI